MKTKEPPTRTTSFRLPVDVLDGLKAIAEKEQRTQTAIIKLLLLDKLKKGPKP